MGAHVAIVDYGMGNLRSVANAVARVAPGREVRVTDDPRCVAEAERVVFPGQGAMPDCMRELDARGLRGAVLDAAATKPFLGICIGLQMLFERSEEGGVAGLGVLRGEVRRFAQGGMADGQGRKLKVPHMGWNEVRQTRMHPLWTGIPDGARFYFVHSYYVVPRDARIVTGVTDYPVSFTCAVARSNIFAVQFHPEKSDVVGLKLLGNFVAWNGTEHGTMNSEAS
jgi:glutamine amidotransferase